MRSLSVNSAFKRARVAVVTALLCMTMTLCCMASAALADEVYETHTVAGVTYTVPADWESLDLMGDMSPLSMMRFTSATVYTKDDGVMLVAFMQEPSLSNVDLDEIKDAAEEAELAIDGFLLMTDMKADIDVVTGLAQNRPVMQFTTTDIHVNGIEYRLTFQICSITGDGGGLLFVVTLLPATGELTEDFMGSFPVAEVEMMLPVGAIWYTVHVGDVYCEGDIFGNDFLIVVKNDTPFVDEMGVMVAMNLALGDFVRMFTWDEVYDVLEDVSDYIVLLDDGMGAWYGSLDLLGLDTLGAEITDGSNYEALLVSQTSKGIGATFVYQPSMADTFIAGVLDGMATLDEPVAAGQDDSAERVISLGL